MLWAVPGEALSRMTVRQRYGGPDAYIGAVNAAQYLLLLNVSLPAYDADEEVDQSSCSRGQGRDAVSANLAAYYTCSSIDRLVTVAVRKTADKLPAMTFPLSITTYLQDPGKFQDATFLEKIAIPLPQLGGIKVFTSGPSTIL